jgi:hypothetical protein
MVEHTPAASTWPLLGFGRKRVYVILDSCFAASAVSDWQGSEIQAAVRKMAQPLPRQGTAFLAAASKYDVTRAPRAECYTVFTGAILEALTRGVDSTQQKMSMYELYEEVRELLRRREFDDDGRPELHSPSQSEGDISRIHLFPNAAYVRAEARRRMEAAQRMAARARELADARARELADARARKSATARTQMEAVEHAIASLCDEVAAQAHGVGAVRTEIDVRAPDLDVETTRTGIDVRVAGASHFRERRAASPWLVGAVAAALAAIGVTVADRNPPAEVHTRIDEGNQTSLVIINSSDGQVNDVGSDIITMGRDPDHCRPSDPLPELHEVLPTAAPPKPTVDPYREVVHRKKVDVNRCASVHGNPPPGTRVVIVVAPDGRPKRVAIDPVSVDATPLGICIKNVFKGTMFPHGNHDHEVEIKLVHPA